MKNILVTLEFESHAPTLIAQAVEIGEKFSAKIWLLHASAPEPDFVGYEVGPQYIRDFRADELREEHRILDQFVKEIEAKGIEADGLLVQGATTDVILEEAQKLEADLLIIGHHPHSWFYKLLNTPTDIHVVNNSRIPVLVVPIDNE